MCIRDRTGAGRNDQSSCTPFSGYQQKPGGAADVYKRQVYGLYAREDIVHPDGATGTIYKAGEQVASLTTDDKGQASVCFLYTSRCV